MTDHEMSEFIRHTIYSTYYRCDSLSITIASLVYGKYQYSYAFGQYPYSAFGASYYYSMIFGRNIACVMVV